MPRIRAAIILLAALSLGCGAGDPNPGPAVAGIRARLVASPLDAEGSLVVAFPDRGGISLTLRLENVGDRPVQLPRSSYLSHDFAKLEVRRAGEDAVLPVHADLYPFDDLELPDRVFETVEPGGALDIDMGVLLLEGYGLVSLFSDTRFPRFHEVVAGGGGAFRTPGEYRITGTYSPRAAHLDGVAHDLFGEDRGRDEAVPVWAGGEVRTEPLPVRVELGATWDDLARRAAASSLVVVGELRGDAEELKARETGPPDYVELGVAVDRTLAGDRFESVVFRVFAGPPAPDRHSAEYLRTQLGERRILFLVQAESRLYLTGAGSGDALPPATEESVERIARVLRLQEELAARPLPVASPIARQVDGLVSGLTADPDRQRENLAMLERLGLDAVPAIVARLDDRRPLPERSVSFANRSSGAFEGVRHYSPEQVVDALAALLNQLTGESFGLSYNRATDAERSHAVRAWRAYAQFLK